MLGSNFALLVRSPGDDGQQLLTTGSRLVCISLVKEQCIRPTTMHSSYYNFIDLCAVLAARYPSYADLCRNMQTQSGCTN